MKRKLMTLALSLLSIWTFSQMRYSDQSVIAVGGGITGKKGFYTNLSYLRFIGERGWVGRADLIYLNQKAFIKDVPEDKEINLTQYLVMPMAQYDFENLGLDPLLLSVYGGGVAGYEVVNKGQEYLTNSGIQSDKLKNNFIYGAVVGAQAELELSRDFGVFVSGTEMFRMNSKIGKFSFMIGAGIKFYL